MLLLVVATAGGCRLHVREGGPATLEKAPDFELVAHTGERYRLSDALQRGPAIVIFYRGHW